MIPKPQTLNPSLSNMQVTLKSLGVLGLELKQLSRTKSATYTGKFAERDRPGVYNHVGDCQNDGPFLGALN